MLCPAGCINRTDHSKGKENIPPSDLTTKKAVFSTDLGQISQTETLHTIPETNINRSVKVLPALPQAGKLQHFVQVWEQLTQDPWILETIQGYRIPFQKQPPSRQIPVYAFSSLEGKAISTEIEKLLRKHSISLAVADDRFVNNIFLVPKKGKQWRLILNLKVLNAYTEYNHFKMEDIRSVKDILCRGDYMCKLDLKKNAYLSVPIN